MANQNLPNKTAQQQGAHLPVVIQGSRVAPSQQGTALVPGSPIVTLDPHSSYELTVYHDDWAHTAAEIGPPALISIPLLIAFLAFIVLYRSPLSDLVRNLKEVKTRDQSFRFEGQQKLEAQAVAQVSIDAAATLVAAADVQVAEPAPDAQHAEAEPRQQNEAAAAVEVGPEPGRLNVANPADAPEKAAALEREKEKFKELHFFETVYRVAFTEQVAFLELLATKGKMSVPEAVDYFDRLSDAFKANVTFEKFIGYLVSIQLARISTSDSVGAYEITLRGRNFIAYFKQQTLLPSQNMFNKTLPSLVIENFMLNRDAKS